MFTEAFWNISNDNRKELIIPTHKAKICFSITLKRLPDICKFLSNVNQRRPLFIKQNKFSAMPPFYFQTFPKLNLISFICAFYCSCILFCQQNTLHCLHFWQYFFFTLTIPRYWPCCRFLLSLSRWLCGVIILHIVNTIL